jgi:hypothetical protein
MGICHLTATFQDNGSCATNGSGAGTLVGNYLREETQKKRSIFFEKIVDRACLLRHS